MTISNKLLDELLGGVDRPEDLLATRAFASVNSDKLVVLNLEFSIGRRSHIQGLFVFDGKQSRVIEI